MKLVYTKLGKFNARYRFTFYTNLPLQFIVYTHLIPVILNWDFQECLLNKSVGATTCPKHRKRQITGVLLWDLLAAFNFLDAEILCEKYTWSKTLVFGTNLTMFGKIC